MGYEKFYSSVGKQVLLELKLSEDWHSVDDFPLYFLLMLTLNLFGTLNILILGHKSLLFLGEGKLVIEISFCF